MKQMFLSELEGQKLIGSENSYGAAGVILVFEDGFVCIVPENDYDQLNAIDRTGHTIRSLCRYFDDDRLIELGIFTAEERTEAINKLESEEAERARILRKTQYELLRKEFGE